MKAGIYGPKEFSKFPFDGGPYAWRILRMCEHKNTREPWMKGYDPNTFTIIDTFSDRVFIVPSEIQKMFEFLINRGMLAQGKKTADFIADMLRFQHADVVVGSPKLNTLPEAKK